MLIEVQFREASDFMKAMFKALPEDVKPQYEPHIARLTAALHHPSLPGVAVISVECSALAGTSESEMIRSEPGWPPAQPPCSPALECPEVWREMMFMCDEMQEIGECDASDVSDDDRRKWDDIAKDNSSALETLSTGEFSVEIVKCGVPVKRTEE